MIKQKNSSKQKMNQKIHHPMINNKNKNNYHLALTDFKNHKRKLIVKIIKNRPTKKELKM